LNVPAVKLLEAVGPVRLIAGLRRAGARPVLSDVSPPGLAIGLGGIGLTLTDLVEVYAAIAHGGMPVALRETFDDRGPTGNEAPMLDERSAWYLGSILSGAPGPAGVSDGRIAFKTGTSYGYRDAWALGFDGRHLVGVWTGRPDAAPVPGLVGIDAAAPILFDAFARIGESVPLPIAPPGVLMAATSDLPPPLRRVRSPGPPELDGIPGPEIAFPPDGAHVELGTTKGSAVGLALEVRNGSPPFTWLANGVPVAHEAFSRSSRWLPDGPGFATLSVIDGRGQSDRVRLFIE
jgi:penicillin-binding protein 1C